MNGNQSFCSMCGRELTGSRGLRTSQGCVTICPDCNRKPQAEKAAHVMLLETQKGTDLLSEILARLPPPALIVEKAMEPEQSRELEAFNVNRQRWLETHAGLLEACRACNQAITEIVGPATPMTRNTDWKNLKVARHLARSAIAAAVVYSERILQDRL